MAGIAPIRAVLFDAVGTLIRPEPGVAEAYAAVARQFSSQLSPAEIAERFPAAFAKFDRANFAAGWPSSSVQNADCPVGWTSSPVPKLWTDEDVHPTCRTGEDAHPTRLSRPPTNQAAERSRWQAIVSSVLHDLPDAAGAPFEALWNHFAQPCHWRLYDDVAETWHALEKSGIHPGIASNFDDRLAGVCRGLPPLDRCENLFWSARVGWPKPSPEFFAHVEQALGLAPREILLVGDDYENDYLGATAAGWQAVLIERSGTSMPGPCNSIRNLGEVIETIRSNQRPVC